MCGGDGPGAGPAPGAQIAAEFGQPLGLPPGEPLWPIREDQQPRVVSTVDEFLECALFQPHIDRVTVLRDGIRLLKQQDAIPYHLVDACRQSRTMRQFLNNVSEDVSDAFKARLWHYGTKGSETEVREKGDKTRTVRAVAKLLKDGEESGEIPRDAPLYISELRWSAKVSHPLVKDEKVKTATQCDIYDVTPLSRKMPLWERSEGGIFVGERGTGSGLHVDQCLWSNIGRQWCGWKLFAVWPWSDRHAILDDAGKGTIFHLPIGEKERAFLGRAVQICNVGPGDVWVFSGGQPHMALGVGDGLCVTAYESMVPAHPEALTTLVSSNTPEAHWKKCWMDDDDLDELYEDVVDALQEALCDPTTTGRLRDRLEGCVAAMRKHGDAYCRRLWAIEDRRARKIAEREQRFPSGPHWRPPTDGGQRRGDESAEGGARVREAKRPRVE